MQCSVGKCLPTSLKKGTPFREPTVDRETQLLTVVLHTSVVEHSFLLSHTQRQPNKSTYTETLMIKFNLKM